MTRYGAVVIALVLGLAGCQTERIVSSDGRPLPPRPRRAPVVPADAVPNRMTLVVLTVRPDDADGNGYPDLIRVQSALFAVPHYTSLAAKGAFVFTLFRRGDAHRADAEAIAEWRFEGDVLASLRGDTVYGTCYVFPLSLTASRGTDRLPPLVADLRGRFEPADGGPPILTSDQVRPIQLGPVLGTATSPRALALPDAPRPSF